MLWIEQHNLFMVLFVVFSFESCDSTSIVECGYLIIYLLTVKTCHFSSVLFFPVGGVLSCGRLGGIVTDD